MRYHPDVGHLYVPGITARMPHARGGYLIRTNAQGFRSDVDFDPAPGERPRILVFGDSFTDGQGVDNAERYSDVLAGILGASVYNYGISGSGPDQQLLLFERLAKHVAADLIVWGIAVHNIERIRHTHRPSTDRITGRPVLVPKPYFTLEAEVLRLHHVPVPRVRPSLEGNERQYLDEPTDLVLAARLRMPRLYEAARHVVDEWFPSAKHRLRSIVYRAANVQVNEDYSDPTSAGWQLLAALIRRFATSAAGTPVLVVPLPTYHYCVDKVRPVYDPLFAGLADPQSGLHVLSLTAGLTSGRRIRERVRYFEPEAHYSPEGHETVAEQLAAEIRRLGLIAGRPAGTAPASTSRALPRSVLGTSFDGRGSAAVLVQDGELVAGSAEDVFVRQRNQTGFPNFAVNYCLEEGGIHQDRLAAVGRARHTARQIERQATWAATHGDEQGWRRVIASWAGDELRTDQALREHAQYEGRSWEWPHGAAQCMAALEGCPFDRAAILCVHDAVDGVVATMATGAGSSLRVVKELPGPYGLGDLARAVSRQLGLPDGEPFRELAAVAGGFGVPAAGLNAAGPVTLTADGFSIRALDARTLEDWLGPVEGVGQPAGAAERAVASVLAVATEAVRRVSAAARRDTGESRVCLCGAVFRVPQAAAAAAASFDEVSVDECWDGHVRGAVGAALLTWQHVFGDRPRSPGRAVRLRGPAFSDGEIQAFLDTYAFPCRPAAPSRSVVADLIARGQALGVFAEPPSPAGAAAGSRLILVRGSVEGAWRQLEAHCESPALLRPPSEVEQGLIAAFGRSDDAIVVAPLQLRGEPVALTPFDAYRCMMEGHLAGLILGRWLLLKAEQPSWTGMGAARRRGSAAVDVNHPWICREARRLVARSGGARPGYVAGSWTAVDSDARGLIVALEPARGRKRFEPLLSGIEPGRLRKRVGKVLAQAARRFA